mgnify:CR=1 FL=1
MHPHLLIEQRDRLLHITLNRTEDNGVSDSMASALSQLLLKAHVEGEVGRKSRVICEVWADDVLTVAADSVFVRVDTEKLKLKAHGQA